MDIFQFLQEQQIRFSRFDHPPVFTCEEVNELAPEIPGMRTKNLLLRDNKGKKHFLLLVPDDRKVDLGELRTELESSRLSMASPERLKKYLDTDPGSVSLFSLLNDTAHAVEVVFEKTIWDAPEIQAHPLINTSTLVISHQGVEAFLAATGHTPRVVELS